MVSIIKSMALNGIDGYLVEVQTDVTSGIPSFNVVGLPDTSIKESKERVKASIKNININIPSRKILVNLSPADKRKEGTRFDLPIALGILVSCGIVKIGRMKDFNRTIYLGELSLDGKIERVKGVLPMCIEAKELGIKKAIVPKANALEVSVLKDFEIIPVSTLKEIISNNPPISEDQIVKEEKEKSHERFKVNEEENNTILTINHYNYYNLKKDLTKIYNFTLFFSIVKSFFIN